MKPAEHCPIGNSLHLHERNTQTSRTFLIFQPSRVPWCKPQRSRCSCAMTYKISPRRLCPLAPNMDMERIQTYKMTYEVIQDRWQTLPLSSHRWALHGLQRCNAVVIWIYLLISALPFPYLLTYFLPYLFTSWLIYFFQNRLVPFPGWRLHEATKPGFSFLCLLFCHGCTVAIVLDLVFQFSILSQEIGWEERLWNDLFCVGLDVKP